MPTPLLDNRQLGPDVARANQLTNGGFEIWQRGSGPFTGGGNAYFADRWYWVAGASASVSIVSDTTNYDIRSTRCAAITYTAGTSMSTVAQTVEVGPGLRGGPITWSMRVKAPVTGGVQLALYDVDGATLLGTGALNATTGAYETLTVTGTPAATTASGKLFCYCQFQTGKSGTYYIDNAMLVVGSQPADYVPMHPADDLARCLRYAELTVAGAGGNTIGMGQCVSTTTAQGEIYFTAKAAVPTVTAVAGSTAASFALTNATSGYINPTAIPTMLTITPTSALSQWIVASGLVAGNATRLVNYSSGGRYLIEANP